MPKNVQTYLKRAGKAYQNRSFDEARSYLHEALKIDAGNADVLHNLGALYDQQQDFARAADYYRQALAAAPDNALIRRGLAALCFEQGDHAAARQLYADLLRTNPNDVDAHFAYSRLTTYRRGDAELDALQAANADMPGLSPAEQIKLHFAYGKAQQDLGEYAAAFQAFRIGNALHYARHPYDEAANFALLDDVERCFDADYLQSHAALGSSDATPIFVLGMPRSGSTLVEQILASHSKVAAAGEVKYLKHCVQKHLIRDKGTFSNALPGWSSKALQDTAAGYLELLGRHGHGARRVVDKMPGNYAFVGLIALLLPEAKIIHTRRDPMATIWSNYSTHFGDALHYTYDLDVLTRYFLRYQQVMAHWDAVLPAARLHDIEYEQLVRDPEQTLGRLFEYLGLAWEPACLDFHTTQRAVKTASVAQVRQPLYATAVDLWQNYSEELAPCAAQLGLP